MPGKKAKTKSSYLCLVTGGAGFIGSNMVDQLLAEGHRVRVLDNLSTGNKSNLDHVMSKISWVEGDLRSEKDVRKSMKGVDYVFHMAANRAVLRSVDDPRETNDINITGTLNILMAARDEKVKRVIFSSSSSVYGDTDKFPSVETDLPVPASPYAASKLMGEHYCRLFSELYGLDTVSLRYFNVFGPRQNPESRYSCVIPILVEAMVTGKRPEIHWDGKQSRDFTYVDNIVHGNIVAMKKQTPLRGEAINIACHEEYSILDILDRLQKILKKKSAKPQFFPKRAGDVRRTLADIKKSQKILGFKTQTRFEEGLVHTVEWFVRDGHHNGTH
jgi:nucleoside-diphosphate-sugar epimerase